MKKRIFYSDNGTLADFTVAINNYHAGINIIPDFNASEDYIYIGSRLPFNHLYVKLGNTVNTELSDLNVSYWCNNSWENVVEVMDETSIVGASFGQSGFITWITDKDELWTREDTCGKGNCQNIEGLTSVEIYDLYWMRISFSNNLTSNLDLSWIGQLFSNDSDLGSEYKSLLRTNVKNAWEAGKIDWEEQHVRAAEIIEKDLVAKKMIHHGEQILEREDLMLPSVHQVAKIIYNELGDDYIDQRAQAEKDYYSKLHTALPTIDINKNARVDYKTEDRINHGRLLR